MKFSIEKFFILNEDSQSNIVNLLGYPKVIARILQERFGKNAFLIAKWLKEYKLMSTDVKNDKWFNSEFSRAPIGMGHGALSAVGGVKMLEAIHRGPEFYKEFLRKNGFYVDDEEVDIIFAISDEKLDLINSIINEIKSSFFKEVFFVKTLIKALENGDIKNIQPYKNLSFNEAEEKFRKTKVFDDKAIIKKYDNGYTWRDVGRRCELTAKLMGNCGSASGMSWDEDRTILVLFDEYNRPHAMVTYSPNDKRISNEEGKGSTELKEKYHNYVIDLADFLGVRLDINLSKSKNLSTKYTLKDIADEIIPIYSDTFSSFFEFKVGGKKYVTDSHYVFSEDDVAAMADYIKNNSDQFQNHFDLPNEIFVLKILFDYKTKFPSNINKISISDFVSDFDNKNESFSIEKMFFI